MFKRVSILYKTSYIVKLLVEIVFLLMYLQNFMTIIMLTKPQYDSKGNEIKIGLKATFWLLSSLLAWFNQRELS